MSYEQLALVPAPSQEPESVPLPDWGVIVNERGVFATGLGGEWWMLFCARFERSGRMTALWLGPQGGQWHVACDTKEDATSLAEHMVSFGGLAKRYVKVGRLAHYKQVSQ